MVLPIALVEKKALRHFDARDPSGSPLPILNSDETAELELDMLLFMFRVDNVRLHPSWREHLRGLLGSGERNRGSQKVEHLLRTGEWGTRRIWSKDSEPQDFTKDMLRNFASHFLMLATVDAKQAGIRQVLKYSYHWDLGKTRLSERLLAPFLAVGALRRIPIPADQPAAARSYHLEFHVQDQFSCAALVLPASSGGPTVADGHIDVSNKPMAHAHATYAEEPREDPYVMVRLPARGLWLSTTLATLFTVLLFGGIQYLDSAKNAWKSSPDPAAALLLAAPAVLFGLLASGREHRLARHALGFLRSILFICTASLFLLATSIVGKLQEDWFEVLLTSLLCLQVAFASFLILGRVGFWIYVKTQIKRLRNVGPAT